MKKLKLYLDTSIWNFYYANDAYEKMDITRCFFNEIETGKYEIYISELVIAEINGANLEKQNLLERLIVKYNPCELKSNFEVEELAEKYIAANFVPAKYEADAIHIAFAVSYNLDVVVSWNFRHIVRLKTRLAVNGINKIEGYKEIEICSPEEVTEYYER
ncbi:MAG: PIN domain-containing protein [Candidatus Scalindua sp.]|nr:PIN domain-containing protein [Candidatus Scalindua sp.]